MAHVLLVEDSATQAAQIRILLVEAGFEAQAVGNGVEALKAIALHTPDIVLTDLEMPEMNGLQLVVAIRREYPGLPVVLMTAFGTEETAIQALQTGAASYVPKRNLEADLVSTLNDVLEVASTVRADARLDECLDELTSRFELPNLASQIVPVIGHVQEAMTRLRLGDETDRLRLGVALDAAIQNAIYFGNLELTPQQIHDAYRIEDAGRSFYRLIHERSARPPFSDRKVQVEAIVSRHEVRCTVRHSGRAFDVRSAMDEQDVLELESGSGQSWLLVRSFMGKLTFNQNGNEVTLSKRYHP